MTAFLRVAWLVVRKDLTVEIRSFEILSTTLFFATTVVLVFSFGLVKEGQPPDDVAAAKPRVPADINAASRSGLAKIGAWNNSPMSRSSTASTSASSNSMPAS